MASKSELEEILIEYVSQGKRLLQTSFSTWDSAFKSFKVYLQKTPAVKTFFDGFAQLPGTDGRMVFAWADGDTPVEFDPPPDEEKKLSCFWKYLCGGRNLAIDCCIAGQVGSHMADGHLFLLQHIVGPLLAHVEEDIEKQIRKLERSEQARSSESVVSGSEDANSRTSEEVPSIVSTDFEIMDVIGRGISATVYKCKDRILDRFVAVRFIEGKNEKSLSHAKTLAVANHPNIVQVHAIVTLINPANSKPCTAVILELIEGKRLREHLQGPRFEISEARRLGQALINGVSHLHENDLAHGDLHSGNVLVSKNAVKIIDLSNYDELRLNSTIGRDAMLEGDINDVRRMLVDVLVHSNINRVWLSGQISDLEAAIGLKAINGAFESLLTIATNELSAESVPQFLLKQDRYNPIELRNCIYSGANEKINAKLCNLGTTAIRRVRTSIKEKPDWSGQELGISGAGEEKNCIFRISGGIKDGSITLCVEYVNLTSDKYRSEIQICFVNGGPQQPTQRDFVEDEGIWKEIK